MQYRINARSVLLVAATNAWWILIVAQAVGVWRALEVITATVPATVEEAEAMSVPVGNVVGGLWLRLVISRWRM